VILDAPGYGVGPPNGHRPAYAPSIGAAAGIAQANLGDSFREQDELTFEQVRLTSIRLQSSTAAPGAQADGFAALGVASAVLLGLLGRARGAGAAELVTTMLNTNAHAMSAQTVDYPGSPGEPAPGTDLRGLHACYRVYDASDGWVFLAAPSEREWRALVTALAPYTDLADDPRFATAEDRAAHDAELVEVLGTVFATRGADAWERDLLAADVACVSVTTAPVEAMYCADEFGRASGYLADVVHPVFDEHPRLAAFARFSRSITPVSGGVLAGAHTDSLLAELGHDGESIADLRARRVVG